MLQSTYTNTLIPISTDTDTENSYKYQIDKPANNNWRLKIRNVQQSDQGIYICRVQLNTQQNEMDTRLIQVVGKLFNDIWLFDRIDRSIDRLIDWLIDWWHYDSDSSL